MNSLFNTVSGKRIAVLGFAFKKDTNDTRESPAIYVCRDLLSEEANLAIYDPRVPADTIRDEIGAAADSRVEICDSAYEAAEGAHAVVILTDWDEFTALDFQRIYDDMERPAFLFDGRNVLDLEALSQIGFEVSGIGKTCRKNIHELGQGSGNFEGNLKRVS